MELRATYGALPVPWGMTRNMGDVQNVKHMKHGSSQFSLKYHLISFIDLIVLY